MFVHHEDWNFARNPSELWPIHTHPMFLSWLICCVYPFTSIRKSKLGQPCIAGRPWPSHPSHLHGGCMKKLERYEENQKRIVNLSYRAPQKIETRNLHHHFSAILLFYFFGGFLNARRQERHMFTTRLPRDFSRVAHHDVPAGKAVWHPGRVSQQHGAGFSWIFAWGKG